MHHFLRGPLVAVSIFSLTLAVMSPAVAATTHAGWVAAADAVCTKGNALLATAIQKAGVDPSKATPAQLKAVTGIVVKQIAAQKAQIAKLPAPSADQPAIKKMLATLQGDLDKMTADPKLVLSPTVTADANKLAKALGLKACGGS